MVSSPKNKNENENKQQQKNGKVKLLLQPVLQYYDNTFLLSCQA